MAEMQQQVGPPAYNSGVHVRLVGPILLPWACIARVNFVKRKKTIPPPCEKLNWGRSRACYGATAIMAALLASIYAFPLQTDIVQDPCGEIATIFASWMDYSGVTNFDCWQFPKIASLD